MALIPSQILRVAILLSYFSILCNYKAIDMPAHQTYGGSWKFLTFIDLVSACASFPCSACLYETLYLHNALNIDRPLLWYTIRQIPIIRPAQITLRHIYWSLKVITWRNGFLLSNGDVMFSIFLKSLLIIMNLILKGLCWIKTSSQLGGYIMDAFIVLHMHPVLWHHNVSVC